MDGSSSPSSFSDLEAGFSRRNSFCCSSYSKSYGRGSYKAMPDHFLDACTLCRKPLLPNSDIFMYRGETPFCSEECREEQIEMDEATKKSRRVSMKRTSAKDQKKSSTINPSHSGQSRMGKHSCGWLNPSNKGREENKG